MEKSIKTETNKKNWRDFLIKDTHQGSTQKLRNIETLGGPCQLEDKECTQTHSKDGVM